MRRRPFRDEVHRLTIAMARVSFKPAAWRKMTALHVAVDGVGADVELLDLECDQTYSRRKRWFRCPSCSRRCNVIGVWEGAWRCPAPGCGAWVGRSRHRASPAGERDASAAECPHRSPAPLAAAG